MDESILESVKGMLAVPEEDQAFDQELIPLINTYLMAANQFGVGKNGFLILDGNETWEDFLGENAEKLAAIKTYISISVRLLFDPPDSSSVLEAFQATQRMLEWRLNSKAEHPDVDEIDE